MVVRIEEPKTGVLQETPSANQHLQIMNKLKLGMEVYCDLHPLSKKHVVTDILEDKGWAIIDDRLYRPISSCFPCETTKLPEYDENIHRVFGWRLKTDVVKFHVYDLTNIIN